MSHHLSAHSRVREGARLCRAANAWDTLAIKGVAWGRMFGAQDQHELLREDNGCCYCQCREPGGQESLLRRSTFHVRDRSTIGQAAFVHASAVLCACSLTHVWSRGHVPPPRFEGRGVRASL